MTHTGVIKILLHRAGDRQKVVDEVLSAECVQNVIGKIGSKQIAVIANASDQGVIMDLIDALRIHSGVKVVEAEFESPSSSTTLVSRAWSSKMEEKT